MTQTDTTNQEKTPQGKTFEIQSMDQCKEAVDIAFDYRGDVTIQTRDQQQLVGYVFDRNANTTPAMLRLMLEKNGEKIKISYEQILRIIFTGRDTALGKSWETWMAKHQTSD